MAKTDGYWKLLVTFKTKKHKLTFVRSAGNQTAASADVMNVYFWVGWTRCHKKKVAKELKELQPFLLSHTKFMLCHDFSALHLKLCGFLHTFRWKILHVELLGSWPCSTTGSSELYQEGC